ncbi:MAG TPA: cation transporter [Ramlibacter sp.]|uniref:heavy-metal-associated domain-containing protein n=1 Tax=Ramlibacter sp. TaxID=1917967 RepID=UPI002D7E4B12|nr:cation transporter [Ramlibacter sp.]HET8744829.1 cation transporter [Ramlibacter sp.]
MNQTFQVTGMTCNHCVGAVTEAVKSVDPQAEVKIDLPSGKVEVQSQQDRGAIARAIEEEGYKVAA